MNTQSIFQKITLSLAVFFAVAAAVGVMILI